MSTKSVPPSCPSLMSTVTSLIELKQKEGSKICGVVLKFMAKEHLGKSSALSHSSSNCAGGAAASIDGKKFEIIQNFNTSALDNEEALKQSSKLLVQKISEVFHGSKTFHDAIDLDFQLTLVTQTAKGGLSTVKQNWAWANQSQESLVMKLIEVEDLSAANKKVCIKILNRSTSAVTAEEIGYLRAELILQCVALKKAPLTLAEFSALSRFAEKTSWRPDVGLCSGLSDGFNLFTLKKLKEKVPLSSMKDLLNEFITSPEYKSALVLQTLNHFNLLKNFGETGFIVNRAPQRPDYLTWPQLRDYMSRYYPEITSHSTQLDQKSVKEKELIAVDCQIIQKAAKLGVVVEDLENMVDREKISTLVQTGLLTGDLATIFGLMQDMKKRVSLLEEIGQLSFKEVIDLLPEMDKIFSTHDEVAIKVSYYDKSREGGHVVSVLYSQSQKTFIFFDSNEGCHQFSDRHHLFQHIVNSMGKYTSFRVSFMV